MKKTKKTKVHKLKKSKMFESLLNKKTKSDLNFTYIEHKPIINNELIVDSLIIKEDVDRSLFNKRLLNIEISLQKKTVNEINKIFSDLQVILK